MLLAVVVLWLVLTTSGEAKVRWRAHVSWSTCQSYAGRKGWEVCKGHLTVPKWPLSKSSRSPSTSSRRPPMEVLTIPLERYWQRPSSSSTEDADPNHHHKIMLAGGPGQRLTVWHEDLPQIMKLWLNDESASVSIYLVDHRRLSGPIDAAEITEDPSYVCTTYAAYDVALLARWIKSNFKVRTLTLMGFSYGGLWAIRTVTLFRGLFDWLLLDSPSMSRGRFERDNDKDYWEACQRAPACSKLVRLADGHSLGGSRTRREKSRSPPSFHRSAQRLYGKLMDGSIVNKCVMQVLPFLYSLLGRLRQGGQGGHGRIHQSMLIPIFTAWTTMCPCPRYYSRVILPQLSKLDADNHGDGDDRADGEGDTYGDANGSQGGLESADGYEVDDFLNNYLCVNELYKYPKRPRACKRDKLVTITDQCSNHAYYRRAWKQLRHRPCPPVRRRKLSTKHTRVVVLLGSLDLITPPRPTEHWLRKYVRAPLKLTLKWGRAGHGIVPQAPCLRRLFTLISQSKERSLTSLDLVNLHRCVSRDRSRPLDWDFNEPPYAFAHRWMAKLL